MNILKEEKIVNVSDWDKLVKETCDKPYSFKQQDGCQNRRIYKITIPSELNNSIPDKNMYDKTGITWCIWLKSKLTPNLIKRYLHRVKFALWLEHSVIGTDDLAIGIFWNTNLYPDIFTITNDMYEKGLIKKGDYLININW